MNTVYSHAFARTSCGGLVTYKYLAESTVLPKTRNRPVVQKNTMDGSEGHNSRPEDVIQKLYPNEEACKLAFWPINHTN
jgi:hypothetical protein